MPTDVAPHEFEPLRFWDAWHIEGRCRACLLPKRVHPTHHYRPARAIGDKRKPREIFHGD